MDLSQFTTPEALRALVARMRAHGIADLRLATAQGDLRIALPPEAAAPSPGPAMTALAPTFGLLRLSGEDRGLTLPGPGDRVAQGAILGFIQQGALWLAVRAPCAGRLGTTLVPEGTRLGHGAAVVEVTPE
ncbi:hypothetical protein GR170_08035 [Pseudooceanicola sp. GBMRC 2024]|uniref:Acetyl-CoA carboxylase biotin carboxyl carrier protein subunit n=1 Tax=Pseudooceanicola albus TaxID=2692189 RepID=A0A6L7G1I2_9RHOB|nr:hypothetical protein [Pseudooceanicola albus]MXN17779.1 hypothetical protein [Pseudooceanicola albus]